MAAAAYRLAAALFFVGAAALALSAGSATASSYGGSGDWVIGAATTESVASETFTVFGNLTVLGTLHLLNSSVTVDRNVTIAGTLNLTSSLLILSVDGPGTNYIAVAGGGLLRITDYDGSAATGADASVLRASTFGFNASFAPGSRLQILNSQVERAGWSVPAPFFQAPGFQMTGASLSVAGSRFTGGFELFILVDSSNASVSNSTFDGFASVLNITGGAGHTLANLVFSNNTLPVRFENVTNVSVSGLTAGPAGPVLYSPPRAPPPGTLVQLLNGSRVVLAGLNITGDPLVAFPRNLTAFVIALSNNITVSSSTGYAGDTFGQASSTVSFSLLNVSFSGFLRPLIMDTMSLLLVDGLQMSETAGAFELRGSSDWDLRNITAVNVSVPAVLGTGLVGTGRLSHSSATTSVGLANLTWANAGALYSNNLSAVVVDYVLAVTGTGFTSFEVNDSRFEAVNLSAVRINTSLLMGLAFTNVTTSHVGEWVLFINATNALLLDVRGVYAVDTVDGVVSLAADAADVLSFANLSALNLTGPVVAVNINGTLSAASFTDLASSNSTGSLLDVFALNLRGINASGLNMTDAQLFPPPDAPGGVTIASNGAQDVTVHDVVVNLTTRQGLHFSALTAVRVQFENVTLLDVADDGVVVVGTAPGWQLDIRQVVSRGGGSATVHLIDVAGALTLTDIDAGGALGIQVEGGQGILITNTLAQGAAQGFVLFNSREVVMRNITADSGVGVEIISCADILVDNATLRGSQWALRAIISLNVTVQGLRAVNTTGGVSLRNVTQVSLLSPAIEFRGAGIQVTLLSRLVSVEGARLTTPTGVTGGILFQASFANNISVTDLDFVGECTQAARIQTVSRVDISHFRAPGCASGIDVSGSTFVNLTDFDVHGAWSGSGLTISSSSDMRVERGDVSVADVLGLVVTGSTRLTVLDMDARDASSDGAFIAYTGDSLFARLRVDGARGLGLRVLSAVAGLVFVDTSATSCWNGVEILSSAGVVFENMDASGALFAGLYVDPASENNTLRNITVRGSGTNGLLIAANHTRLIDGNFSSNVQGGIAVWPGVRLDWTVEVAASVDDERIELTGDLLVLAGARFAAHASVITVDQTARLTNFEANTLVSFGPGSTVSFDSVTIEPRDKTIPYAILAAPGANLSIRFSSLRGGAPQDPASAFTASSCTLDLFWSDFTEWGAPLDLTDCHSTIEDVTFTRGTYGLRIFGGDATLINVTSTLAAVDGVFVQGATALVSADLFVAYNGGRGVYIDGVPFARLDGLVTISDTQGEVVVNGSSVVGSRWSLRGSQATGLVARGGALLDIEDFSSVSNDGAGAVITAVLIVRLGLNGVTANGGTGILVRDVDDLTLTGGLVSDNLIFGLELAGRGSASIEGVRFDGDGFANVRIEDNVRAQFANSTLATEADHAVMVVGASEAIFTNVGASGNLTGLMASDTANVTLMNSSTGEPTVLGSAGVSIGWHLRVIVQTAAGVPAGGITVNVTNASGALVAQGVSDDAGLTPLIPVIERVLRANATTETFGPQGVSAWSATLGRARGSINLTHYSTLGLRLDDAVPTTTAENSGTPGQRGWYLGPVDVILRATDDRAETLTLFYRIAAPSATEWSSVTSQSMAAAATVPIRLEGLTTVEFYAVDAAGNEEPRQTLDVRTDLHEPSVDVASLPAVVFVPELLLSWEGNDGNGSGVFSYSIDYADSTGRFANWMNDTLARSSTFDASDGNYTFRVVAYDAAGRSSVPVFTHVTVALLGFVRLHPIDAAGNAIVNVSVWLGGERVLENLSGYLEVRAVPSGNVTLLLTAPGYDNLTVNATVRGHETTDIGNVTMRPAALPSVGVDLTAGLLVLGALLIVTIAYGVRIRLKWRKRGGQV